MCTVCGCGTKPRIDAEPHDHEHSHDHDHEHTHEHDHDGHHHGPNGDLHFGKGAAGVHVAGQSQTRLIEIEQDILSKNSSIAQANRAVFEREDVLAINMMSSPGSGKTTLLVDTLNALKDELPVAVIEGDQETTNDADRIRATGVPAIQVNTGKGCHLDADMIASAVDHMDLPRGGILFIENVGNLVCPAGFDLGEQRRVVIASITEGEDKPLKYPDMFASADAMVISKTDLLPYLDCDIDALSANARQLQPRLDIIKASAGKVSKLDAWLRWLRGLTAQLRSAAE